VNDHRALPDHPQVGYVASFEELVAARFSGNINALCWPRRLVGDFGEVVAALGPGDGVVTLDEELLASLPLGQAGRAAASVMLDDLRLLRDRQLDPVLNCIHAYPRDAEDAVVATDVMSFHVDSAPVEADTWLCTYHGAPSEGIANAEALRKIDHPAIRAALLGEFGGADDADFADYLGDACYDLHYTALPGANPYSFGLFNLWRIATLHPGSSVLPCIHRAPTTPAARLLLIS
jgi:hypothetical protein